MISIRLICRNKDECQILLPEVPLVGDTLIIDRKEYTVTRKVWNPIHHIQKSSQHIIEKLLTADMPVTLILEEKMKLQ